MRRHRPDAPMTAPSACDITGDAGAASWSTRGESLRAPRCVRSELCMTPSCWPVAARAGSVGSTNRAWTSAAGRCSIWCWTRCRMPGRSSAPARSDRRPARCCGASRIRPEPGPSQGWRLRWAAQALHAQPHPPHQPHQAQRQQRQQHRQPRRCCCSQPTCPTSRRRCPPCWPRSPPTRTPTALCCWTLQAVRTISPPRGGVRPWRQRSLRSATRSAPRSGRWVDPPRVIAVDDPAGWGRDCDTWDDVAALRSAVGAVSNDEGKDIPNGR